MKTARETRARGKAESRKQKAETGGLPPLPPELAPDELRAGERRNAIFIRECIAYVRREHGDAAADKLIEGLKKFES